MPGTWGVTKQTEISALTAHGVTFTPFIRVTASEKKNCMWSLKVALEAMLHGSLKVTLEAVPHGSLKADCVA